MNKNLVIEMLKGICKETNQDFNLFVDNDNNLTQLGAITAVLVLVSVANEFVDEYYELSKSLLKNKDR